MKKYLGFVLLFVYLFTAQGWAFPKDDKKKYTEGAGVGIVYSLPRTGVRVTVTASCEKVFRGPYYQFAEKYLNMKNAAVSDFENWKIKSIQLNVFSEADPAHTYPATGANAALVNVTSEGILGGINQPVVEVAKPVFTSENIALDPTPRIIFPELLVNDFFKLESDSGKAKRPIPQTLEERAKVIAHELARLGKRKAKMLTGDYEKMLPDGEAFHVMVDEVSKLEEEYVAMFMGKSFRYTRQYVFNVIPSAEGKEPVFRFSPDKGVLQKNEQNGNPVFVEYQPEEIQLLKQNTTDQSQNVGGELFYRVPVNTLVKVTDGNGVLASSRFPIAQFGSILPIPVQLLDGNYSIQLDPLTGTIKSIQKKKVEGK
ncbi:MAG: DUF4831 family protein [Bacteroidota bacterium]|nr:DUF4831 family protein [Bacteroidota bacterium]MDP4204824.1 DUF4831 family protein [Bacteroidota bacterium]